ncbi:iron dependent repressor, metal binding and dimerization domain protein [Candidatus Protochlamydia phocaeensis]|uniref:iron dependent repressor, metal binding and dimerization domain protein n=1 Tax=Candidatus Protochlamydia phocaeensis TaxID=1414722 RepID=UPI000838B64B|nr:iron dependent repressor, metal binding and dimerization domain protein [Candidatus Protochlamydia phocaeensis]
MTSETVSGSQRAAHFKETRLQRLTEVVEDYTELIGDLIQAKGHARVCDIAREMGISHVSVVKTLKKLMRDGYILKEEHHIYLTPKGQEMAAFSKRKHLILFEFLIKLGVPESIAAIDVEGIEHHISATTLSAIEAHLQTLQ